jgi:branched-chain amino acid transport system ATP-binding protein
MTLLQVDGLVARHGLLQAVRGVSFTVADGEILAVVGANGAGKSTLLRTIAGAHPAAEGTISFDGADITGVPAHLRVKRGIALVPEGRRLFADLSVQENLLVAGRRGRSGSWNLDTVLDAFAMLKPLRQRKAATLSGGQQQATAIARALMTNPRLLLVDEMSLGLAPVAIDAVYESMSVLSGSGATLILVEQDLTRALSVADRVLCVLEGQIVLNAVTNGVTREQVTAAYFGLERAGPASPAAGSAAVEGR